MWYTENQINNLTLYRNRLCVVHVCHLYFKYRVVNVVHRKSNEQFDFILNAS